MNYTLFIESGNGSLVLALHGPFQHLGSGILEHDITFHGLEEGGNYLLRIEVETNFENYTNYYPFGNHLTACLLIILKLLMFFRYCLQESNITSTQHYSCNSCQSR